MVPREDHGRAVGAGGSQLVLQGHADLAVGQREGPGGDSRACQGRMGDQPGFRPALPAVGAARHQERVRQGPSLLGEHVNAWLQSLDGAENHQQMPIGGLTQAGRDQRGGRGALETVKHHPGSRPGLALVPRGLHQQQAVDAVLARSLPVDAADRPVLEADGERIGAGAVAVARGQVVRDRPIGKYVDLHEWNLRINSLQWIVRAATCCRRDAARLEPPS